MIPPILLGREEEPDEGGEAADEMVPGFMLVGGKNIGIPRFIIGAGMPGIPGKIGRGNTPDGPAYGIIIGLKVGIDGIGIVCTPARAPAAEAL